MSMIEWEFIPLNFLLYKSKKKIKKVIDILLKSCYTYTCKGYKIKNFKGENENEEI